jgi:hypothetical protein
MFFVFRQTVGQSRTYCCGSILIFSNIGWVATTNGCNWPAFYVNSGLTLSLGGGESYFCCTQKHYIRRLAPRFIKHCLFIENSPERSQFAIPNRTMKKTMTILHIPKNLMTMIQKYQRDLDVVLYAVKKVIHLNNSTAVAKVPVLYSNLIMSTTTTITTFMKRCWSWRQRWHWQHAENKNHAKCYVGIG